MTARRHLRWKRDPAETGLRSIGARPRGWTLHDGETDYARVAPNGGGWQSKQKGWFWVAFADGVPHFNTCQSPQHSPDDAKADALAYVREHLGKATGETP